MDSDGAVAAAAAGGAIEADDSGTLPGASSLVEQLNRHVLVCLRDGRNILGWLRSFDQFANLVLDKAVERVVVESSFGDIPLGIFMIRGENVMLLAEVDSSREHMIGSYLQQVSSEQIQRARKAQNADKDSIKRKERLEWPLQEDYL